MNLALLNALLDQISVGFIVVIQIVVVASDLVLDHLHNLRWLGRPVAHLLQLVYDRVKSLNILD